MANPGEVKMTEKTFMARLLAKYKARNMVEMAQNILKKENASRRLHPQSLVVSMQVSGSKKVQVIKIKKSAFKPHDS